MLYEVILSLHVPHRAVISDTCGCQVSCSWGSAGHTYWPVCLCHSKGRIRDATRPSEEAEPTDSTYRCKSKGASEATKQAKEGTTLSA